MYDIYLLTYRSDKLHFKNSCIHIVIQIYTEIERHLASHPSHPQIISAKLVDIIYCVGSTQKHKAEVVITV